MACKGAGTWWQADEGKRVGASEGCRRPRHEGGLGHDKGRPRERHPMLHRRQHLPAESYQRCRLVEHVLHDTSLFFILCHHLHPTARHPQRRQRHQLAALVSRRKLHMESSSSTLTLTSVPPKTMA